VKFLKQQYSAIFKCQNNNRPSGRFFSSLSKIKTVMSYKTTFTITPASGPYLMPFDIIGKIADGEECCVVNHNGATLCAIHRGGEFTRPGSAARVMNVKEATPIPPESQWPAGCDWSTDDWEERRIYPPRPVQPAVLIVELSDGRKFEVVAPFTDEEDQEKLNEFVKYIDVAYWRAAEDRKLKTRWAWMPE
jgi:hypothetical protein